MCCAFAVAACFIAGCPGKLDDKQSFLDYVPTEAGPETGAPLGGGPGAGGGPSDGACGDIIDRVFAPSCGDTGCHGAVAPQQDLDLVSPNVASRVVGISGKACVSVLADPANPEGSLLYKKLMPAPGCGAQMPLARPPLSSEDAACVLAWIAAQ
ncbi:MAG: hypothetical protein ABUL62_14045 [Myxococcales bacterium]|jgi:hypothetical protein